MLGFDGQPASPQSESHRSSANAAGARLETRLNSVTQESRCSQSINPPPNAAEETESGESLSGDTVVPEDCESDQPSPTRSLSSLAGSYLSSTPSHATSFVGLRADNFWPQLFTTFSSPTRNSNSPQTASKMFGNVSNEPQTRGGPDLEEIQTEAIGFLSLAGESKIRLLQTPWPSETLPPPTSSLLSIASRKHLLAAAAPDALIIGSTDAIREAFVKDGPSQNNVKSFSPQLSIPIPRVTQVAFSSDENFLTICAQEGGGLAIYDVQSLLQGNSNPVHQLATNGIPVRALVPNPAEGTAHIQALVLANGQLMLADLKERQFISGPSGPVLKEGVSCVAWSAKGKQLVAGLGNGTSAQLKPDGSVVADIPKPPQLQGDEHVSSIFWLANDIFLLIHTPTGFDQSQAPDSTFTLVNRQKQTTNFVFQKLPDPCPPFGLNRSPPHHFISRLRDFPPTLNDALIVSSSASSDVGLFTSSKIPLTRDFEAEKITNHYTTTSMANEARRAQLPVNEMSADTSPIGMALDLSSNEQVKRPIPGEELEATSTPLPALMILNNEGVLSSWWFVYSDSVKQGTSYPGLNISSEGATRPQSSSGTSGFGQPQSGFGASFGSSTETKLSLPRPQFGASTAAPAFGSTSGFAAMGANKSPWGTASVGNAPSQPTSIFGSSSALGANNTTFRGLASNSNTQQGSGAVFGQPTFGSSTPVGGGGFGAVGNIGNRASPWAVSQPGAQSSVFAMSENPAQPFGASNTSSISPFGGLTSNSSSTASPFGALSTTNPSSSSPFEAVNKMPQKPSIFSQPATSNAPGLTPQPSFGSTITIGSSMGVSSFGGTSTLGSNKSPWQTPGLSSKSSGEPFGKSGTDLPQSPEAEMTTGDEIPQPQKHDDAFLIDTDKSRNPFGLGSAHSKVAPTPKGDEAASDHLTASGKSPFGLTFANTLDEIAKPDKAFIKKEPTDDPILKSPESPLSPKTAKTSLSPRTLQDSESGPETPIKREPGITEPRMDEILSTTPATPAQPPVSSLTTFSSSKNALTAQAKSLATPEVAVPSDPQVEPEPAPLPPSPGYLRENKGIIPSPPLSPPTDLGVESGSSGLSPTHSALSEEYDQEEDQEEPEEAPLPPDFVSNPVPTPSWTLPPIQETSTTPKATNTSILFGNLTQTPMSTQKPVAQKPLFGAIDPPSLFPRPGALQESPRSPSPTRPIKPLRSISPRRNQGATTSTPPNSTSFSLFNQKQTPISTTPMGPPPFKPAPRSVTQPNLSSARLAPVEEAQSDVSSELGTEDDEDQRIQQLLASDVEPGKVLEPFLAHQDYVGHVAGTGIPAQIEKVYRDVCSMIDTLGLNARALESWIKGQSELIPMSGRERKDLDNAESWCLIEIQDLALLETELQEKLDAERLDDVSQKLEELHGLHTEALKQNARSADLRRLLASRTDPDELAAKRNAPLTAEQASILANLRKEYARLQAQLSEAENALSLLKARIVTLDAQRAQHGNTTPARQLPTAEAVANTIRKMTAMFEKRRTDMDLLEAKMRKLGLERDGVSATGKENLRASVNGRSSKNPSGAYTLEYSPSNSQGASDDGDFRDSRSSQRRTRRSLGGAELASVSKEDIEAYKAKKARRQMVLNTLKEKIMEHGTRITEAY